MIPPDYVRRHARAHSTSLDRARHINRIQSETAHRGIKKIRLFFRESADNVLDRNVVLIPASRFVHRVLENPLAALAEFVFVCF